MNLWSWFFATPPGTTSAVTVKTCPSHRPIIKLVKAFSEVAIQTKVLPNERRIEAPKQRAVFMVGRTGLGKTTFTNIFTGSNYPTSDRMTSTTTKPTATTLTLTDNGPSYIVVDFPGVRDISNKALKDEEIYAMIAKEAILYDVVAVIVFVSQEDVLAAKLSREFVELTAILQSRFTGYESVVYFAISGEVMLGTIQEFISRAFVSFQRGKFQAMGISHDNWSRCKDKDFEGVNAFCCNRLQAEDPVVLTPKQCLDTCGKCGVVADPLYKTDACYFHPQQGSGSSLFVHSKNIIDYHRKAPSSKHRGKWQTWTYMNPCRGKWTCCGNREKDSRCFKKTYDCCEKPFGEVKCQKGTEPPAKMCADCGKDVSEQGCKGACAKCGRAEGNGGCISVPCHSWKNGGVTASFIEALKRIPSDDGQGSFPISFGSVSQAQLEWFFNQPENKQRQNESTHKHCQRMLLSIVKQVVSVHKVVDNQEAITTCSKGVQIIQEQGEEYLGNECCTNEPVSL